MSGEPERTGPASLSSPEKVSTPAAELRRIDFTGTIWFAAAIIASTVPLGVLLAAGWRPGSLTLVLAFVWWAGAAAVAGGVALLAWAGCPVLGFSLEKADRQKSFCIRTGVVLYFAGTVAAALAVLLSAPTG